MLSRVAFMLLAGALALPCAALAAPPPPPPGHHHQGPPPMVRELLDCGRIQSSGQRLMCYDRLRDKVRAREASHRHDRRPGPPPHYR